MPKHPPKKSGPAKTRSRSIKEREFVLCGWNACMQAFQKRPEQILRVFFSKARSRALNPVKKWCSSHKLPYRELDIESLNKAAGSVHHEGVVLVVQPLTRRSVHSLLDEGLSKNGILVALDGVGNVHNVGAILRSCAYFGADGLLLSKGKEQAAITPSAARTAEGAMEQVPIYECTDLASALRDFRSRGVFVLGTDASASQSLYETRTPLPCVVTMGNEHEGLSKRVKHRCDAVVNIPGNGVLESLNVSVAAGVVLAELSRRHRT